MEIRIVRKKGSLTNLPTHFIILIFSSTDWQETFSHSPSQDFEAERRMTPRKKVSSFLILIFLTNSTHWLTYQKATVQALGFCYLCLLVCDFLSLFLLVCDFISLSLFLLVCDFISLSFRFSLIKLGPTNRFRASTQTHNTNHHHHQTNRDIQSAVSRDSSNSNGCYSNGNVNFHFFIQSSAHLRSTFSSPPDTPVFCILDWISHPFHLLGINK